MISSSYGMTSSFMIGEWMYHNLHAKTCYQQVAKRHQKYEKTSGNTLMI